MFIFLFSKGRNNYAFKCILVQCLIITNENMNIKLTKIVQNLIAKEKKKLLNFCWFYPVVFGFCIIVNKCSINWLNSLIFCPPVSMSVSDLPSLSTPAEVARNETCPELPDVSNGWKSSSQSELVQGTMVTYQCYPGYQMSGSEQLICQWDLTWSGDIPSCERGEKKYVRSTSHQITWERGHFTDLDDIRKSSHHPGWTSTQ